MEKNLLIFISHLLDLHQSNDMPIMVVDFFFIFCWALPISISLWSSTYIFCMDLGMISKGYEVIDILQNWSWLLVYYSK